MAKAATPKAASAAKKAPAAKKAEPAKAAPARTAAIKAPVAKLLATGSGRSSRSGHRRRRRRAFRRRPAEDPERAGDDERLQPADPRSGAASWRKFRPLHRHGHVRGPGSRPGSLRHGFADHGAGRRRDARPHHERHRRAGRRGRPGRDQEPPRHPPGCAGLCRPVDGSADSRHRHQGRRPARALRSRRQDRPVRRRRRRQDRADPGTDQQRRQGAWRLFGVCRRRRAHPRRQRPLSRNDRIRRQQGPARNRLDRRFQMRPGVRPDERAARRARPRRAVGPHHRRAFPRPGPGRAVLRRQHLPLHAGGFGSVGAARPHPLGRGLPADARHRHGHHAGAHHVHPQGFDHFGAGDLRAGRRLDRPGAGDILRAP